MNNSVSKTSQKRKKKIETPVFITMEESTEKELNDPKKRGRKPKGGKLIVNSIQEPIPQTQIVNIIMHLKCSLKDLNNEKECVVKDPLSYDPSIPPEIKTYNETMPTKQFSIYNENSENNIAYREPICQKCATSSSVKNPDECIDNEYADINMKDIHIKLKQLRMQYCKNYPVDKKSACFWCTYEFDNPACFIPKYDMNNTIFGYGSFCRPECAVAFLWSDNVDDSTKFERYHLLNQIYGKVYGFKKNIKPAPDPHYLLDKFYGNMTIQEYRKLLKTEYLLQVLDKPMTRILPEVHEDNDDFLLNVYGGVKQQIKNTGGVYKVKRQSEKQKGPTKNSIARTNFGLSE
jgi:hypothetical protein